MKDQLSYLFFKMAKVMLRRTHGDDDVPCCVCFLLRSFMKPWQMYYLNVEMIFNLQLLKGRGGLRGLNSGGVANEPQQEFWWPQQEVMWIKLCVNATESDVKSARKRPNWSLARSLGGKQNWLKFKVKQQMHCLFYCTLAYLLVTLNVNDCVSVSTAEVGRYKDLCERER